MRKAVFIGLYAAGLSAFLPLYLLYFHGNAWLVACFAPVGSAFLAEVLARSFRFTGTFALNRVMGLVVSFVFFSQMARFYFGRDIPGSFTEYMALSALYQIVILVCFLSEDRAALPEVA